MYKVNYIMILLVMNTIFSNCLERRLKKSGLQRGLNPGPCSNPVQVMKSSGFSTQVLRIVFITTRVIALLAEALFIS